MRFFRRRSHAEPEGRAYVGGPAPTGASRRDSGDWREGIWGAPEFLAEDVEFQIHGLLTMDGSWRGVAQVVAAMASNFSRVSDQKPTIEAMIQQGDGIALRFHETGRLQGNNAAYVARGVIWFSFVENRISRVEEFIHSALLP